MTFGVSVWLWTSPVTTEVIEQYAPKISGMGFDTMEIPIEDPVVLDTERISKVLKENGLNVTTCAAMGGGRDLIHPDPDVRKETMQYLIDSIDIANQIGSKKFVGPIYSEIGRLWKSTNKEKKAEKELLVSQLKELAGYGKQKDVVICLEALNRFETSFLNLTEQVTEIVDQVNHENCKVMIDLFHAGIEEKDLGDAIRNAGKDLHHLQVAENDRGTPGTGQFDWQNIANAVRDIDYDGDVIIETFTPDNELLAKAAAIWRPLAESPDALASDGLRFLKKLFE